ncbi:hypothetical protein F5884DRAFT_847788 [Xylogone sp. PMI_703]|nr:hypothetical protein F5884DRAFT_847788 [Xylogone sp. PMI_703]
MYVNLVILILGAGPRIGASDAEKVAKRSNVQSAEGSLPLEADSTEPDSIPAIFDIVETELRTSPGVVVYNAAALTQPSNQESPFPIPAEYVASDLKVNTISPHVAAQQAVKGWEKLPKETEKTCIYTGNIMNISIIPPPLMMYLGMGKSASAFWIGLADTVYAVLFADECHGDGKFKGMVLDGPPRGEFYMQLANQIF